MAVLTLPSSPSPASMTVELISSSSVLTSALNSDEQEIRRKGSRYALTYSMPVMSYSLSMDWDDLMSEGDLVRMRVHQPGFDTGVPGAAKVNGAGQSGTSLILDGLTPQYVIKKGQFLNVTTAGQLFLYRTKADVVVNEDGQATVQLRTMLRRPPADNDAVEIADPMVEGFVRDLGEWAVGIERLVTLKFTVRERA